MKLTTGIEQISHVIFITIGWVMKIAPLSALAAMSYIIGQYGLASLGSFAKLIWCCYLTAVLHRRRRPGPAVHRMAVHRDAAGQSAAARGGAGRSTRAADRPPRRAGAPTHGTAPLTERRGLV